MNTAIVWATWLANTVMDTYTKVRSVYADVYRLYTTERIWYIADNGQFADSSYMDVEEGSRFWLFDGSTILGQAHSIKKRLEYLSCEMRIGTTVVPMDDFFENVKYGGDAVPPFSVIMAAFMISKKKFYPWTRAHFKVFLRDGEEREFDGSP